jgi:hypothetical protein
MMWVGSNMPDERKHSLLVGIGEKVISFVIGLIVAAFFLGGARQRVASLGRDMDNWKTEWKTEHAPRIERMDRVGTTSFALFHAEYERTQHRQEESLKDLDKRMRDLERKQP